MTAFVIGTFWEAIPLYRMKPEIAFGRRNQNGYFGEVGSSETSSQ